MRSETSTLGVKRSKREENGIIIHFAFYFILTIGLIVFVIISIVPEISKIEKDKDITKEIYENIQRIEHSGLNFNEFSQLSSQGKKDKVIIEILKNMKEDFYIENLVNNTEKSYSEFLDEKNKKLNTIENTKTVDNQIAQVATILPTYSQTAIDLGGGSLTDYMFINYIESIIETFGLSTNSSIGISKIKLVEDYVGSNNSGDSLESNIFYIPLSLILKGKKSGILDFLYFIENVGNIKTDDKNILLEKVDKLDGFLYKNGIETVLEGEKYTSDYNILAHQIIDIEKISMEEYIDSSYKDRGETDFKDFIIKNQGNEDFEIKVNLLFYVKGLPTYKIEEYINNIFQKHIETIGLISDSLKNTKLVNTLRRKLTQQSVSLNQMNKEILSIKKELEKKDKIEELYKRAMKLNEIIDPIFKSLKK